MIEINNLSYKYPDGTLALDTIDLCIREGEFVVIAGRNGSGKSTLIRHINGLLQPSKGSVVVNGIQTSERAGILSIRQAVGMVFQNPESQFVGITVEEDVAFGLENLGVVSERIRELVDSSLKAMNLFHLREHMPRYLSGGEKQKVAIAGILAMKPDYLIFDEVTSMLDPFSRQEILASIKQIHEKGTTVVYVTHRLEEAVDADRLIVMDSGRIVLDDSPRAVFRKYELESYGLRLPPLVKLSKRLFNVGIVGDGIALSKEELVEKLCQ